MDVIAPALILYILYINQRERRDTRAAIQRHMLIKIKVIMSKALSMPKFTPWSFFKKHFTERL